MDFTVWLLHSQRREGAKEGLGLAKGGAVDQGAEQSAAVGAVDQVAEVGAVDEDNERGP